MYICDICGTKFDEPQVITERRHDEDGHRETMRYESCPICGEDRYHKFMEEIK